MYIPTNNKVLVSCESSQKDYVLIGESIFKTANLYEQNYRIKSPTICTVIEGNELVHENDALICHHNLFYTPSPYHLYDNIFSIPFSKVLFAKILQNGSLLPICGNVLGNRINKVYDIPAINPETYNDRLSITHSGYTKYSNGQIIFTRPSACYDIVYNWNNEQKTVTKVSEDMVCAIAK